MKKHADNIEQALDVFTPAALTSITITTAARARAVQENAALEAALNPVTTTAKPKKEDWRTYVYGGARNPNL